MQKEELVYLLSLPSIQMDLINCTSLCLIYTIRETCLFVEVIIYGDRYYHLPNFLFNMCRRRNLSICWANHICRWIWSSVKLIGCSIQMDEIICTCIFIEFISVQMDTFICTYTSLVINYMLMDMVMCISKMLVYADGWSLIHLYIGFLNLFADG